MKYTTPNYEVEAVETKDIITESTAIADAEGKTIGYIVNDPDNKKKELLVPDVSDLL